MLLGADPCPGAVAARHRLARGRRVRRPYGGVTPSRGRIGALVGGSYFLRMPPLALRGSRTGYLTVQTLGICSWNVAMQARRRFVTP